MIENLHDNHMIEKSEENWGKQKGKNAAALHYLGPGGISQLKRLVWIGVQPPA